MDVPPTPHERAGRWRFGVFDFDGLTFELTKNGRSVPVRPQPLKVLALLLERPGEIISRDDLQRALWGGDTFVDFEQGVNHAVRELRAAWRYRRIPSLYPDVAPAWLPFRRARGGGSFLPSKHRRQSRAGAVPDTAANAGTAPSRFSRMRMAPLRRCGGRVLSRDRHLHGGADWRRPARLISACAGRRGRSSLQRIRLSGSASPMRFRQGWVASRPSRYDRISRTPRRVDEKPGSNDWPSGRRWRSMVRSRRRIARSMWRAPSGFDRNDCLDGSNRGAQRRVVSGEDVIAERVVAALHLRLAASEQDRLRRRYTQQCCRLQRVSARPGGARALHAGKHTRSHRSI